MDNIDYTWFGIIRGFSIFYTTWSHPTVSVIVREVVCVGRCMVCVELRRQACLRAGLNDSKWICDG